jgi:uncharacterized membrane protein YphA (DoxX/SURF4 family)
MDIDDFKKISPTLLRISLGFFFTIAGLTKVVDPSGIVGMVGDMGFPAPFDVYFGLLTMIAEIVFGLTLLIGLSTKFSVFPLIIIMVVAAVGIHLPKIDEGAMAIVILLFHLVTIIALIHVALIDPGPFSLDK